MKWFNLLLTAKYTLVQSLRQQQLLLLFTDRFHYFTWSLMLSFFRLFEMKRHQQIIIWSDFSKVWQFQYSSETISSITFRLNTGIMQIFWFSLVFRSHPWIEMGRRKKNHHHCKSKQLSLLNCMISVFLRSHVYNSINLITFMHENIKQQPLFLDWWSPSLELSQLDCTLF